MARANQIALVLGGTVVGGDDGLALADDDAQAEIEALGAFELFDLAQTLAVRQRDAVDQHGVGLIGAGALGAADEVAQE